MVVVRKGHVVAEGWWTPYSPDRPHLLYSLAKSFTAIAVGLASPTFFPNIFRPMSMQRQSS